LVETYQLAWMKVDFNFSLVTMAAAGVGRYYAAWYRLIDEIRAAYPGTFFEGCASGGCARTCTRWRISTGIS